MVHASTVTLGAIVSLLVLVDLPVGKHALVVAKSAAAPAQVTLCVNIVYLLVLSTTTLPLYSLVVQMGSDFKAGLLPPDVRARLEAAAEEVWFIESHVRSARMD